MKIKFLIATISAIACMTLLTSNNSSQVNINDSVDESLIACMWHPYCGEPDIYSPVAQPEDKKTDTKDTKDIKLA
ncbi:hypothetical protein [Rheinheimera baltica]|uniref:Uncharacterized protein n=1 Tax=Rheinheimera baltica TaxID=67576 RepID=A0ABT9HXY2_9GAMM|nr:hypothetical protein [Rheinheimera baltica]MDP5135999.1 hypothetical protein [Rheinheimera baltica]MDP5144391.1 hypothetical protein [Rheinheimera baltica]MDP5189742.1 hypothetical protein [Rheinheimera baltica]